MVFADVGWGKIVRSKHETIANRGKLENAAWLSVWVV